MLPDGLVFEKAGQTEGGMVYIIASLDNYDIFGDEMKPYIIFQNSHNGSIPMKAALTTLRMVCQNQFTVAFKHASNVVKVRHTANANQRMAEAQRIMNEAITYRSSVAQLAEELHSIKLNSISANRIAAELFPYTENDSKLRVERAEESRSKLLSIYRYDDDLANHRNTGWGMLNAYSDFVTHAQPNRMTKNWEENKFVSVLNTNMNNAIEIIESVA